jgi:hypothetical protein
MTFKTSVLVIVAACCGAITHTVLKIPSRTIRLSSLGLMPSLCDVALNVRIRS